MLIGLATCLLLFPSTFWGRSPEENVVGMRHPWEPSRIQTPNSYGGNQPPSGDKNMWLSVLPHQAANFRQFPQQKDYIPIKIWTIQMPPKTIETYRN